jgi:hypothetical protein
MESRINRTSLSALKYLVFKIRHPGNKGNKEIQGPDGMPEGPDANNNNGGGEENEDIASQDPDDE